MSEAETLFPRQGEIWLVDFNRKKVKEIDKIRPALIMNNNLQNELDEKIVVAPSTSLDTEIIEPFEVFAESSTDTGLDKPSKFLFNYIQAINKELRLIKKLGAVDEKVMQESKKALKLVFVLD